MKTKISIAVTLILLLISQLSFSQTFDGLWGVVSVHAGDRLVTPVAKWFLIEKDGVYKSGNGWTQNSVGTWTYDESTGQFAGHSTNDIKDEYGAFNLKLDQGKMIWDRMEDGMKVTVVLQQIAEIPAAPADLVQGLWKLTSVMKDDVNMTSTVDPQSKQFLHIRPDKRFRLRTSDNSGIRGFWHMNGHRPRLTLIHDDRSVDNLAFTVEIVDNQLMMRQAEKGIVYTYQRIFEFPD